MNNQFSKSNSAFTLVELVVVIAIIAILSGIAIPQYSKYIRRSVCENGKAVLVGAAQMLERYYAQNNKYKGVNLSQYGYHQAPIDGKAQFKIELSHPKIKESTEENPRAYILTATPLAGSKLNRMGTLSIDNVGVRNATGEFKNKNVWQGCGNI